MSTYSTDPNATMPEWVVGQQVSGTDYERLPVGSRATWTYRSGSKPVPSMKVGDDSWCEGEGADAAIRSNREMSLPRTLIHLPEHAEPEDTDDAYVEPEPLKEGDSDRVTINTLDREEIHRLVRVLVAKRVRLVIGPGDSVPSEIINRVIEALREFANPKPARCTSLRLFEDGTGLSRCVLDAGHGTDHDDVTASWADEDAYGRVEVSS